MKARVVPQFINRNWAIKQLKENLCGESSMISLGSRHTCTRMSYSVANNETESVINLINL